MIKTGECYYRDENDILWLAESFANGDGEVFTVVTEVYFE